MMSGPQNDAFVRITEVSSRHGMSLQRKRPRRVFEGSSTAIAFQVLIFIGTILQNVLSFSPSAPRNRIRQTAWMVSAEKQRKSFRRKPRTKEPIVGLAGLDDWIAADQPSQRDRGYRPIPSMPSPLFASLAQSQLELLAHSLTLSDSSHGKGGASTNKIKSMALYLPQENAKTGQLEFLPAVLYPPPSSDRVFIASDADSGVAPLLPKILTKLPGFAHATSLIPGYPMVSSSSDSDSAVGEAEEVMCDPITKNTAISVPLFSGSQTVGVLLVWPSVHAKREGASVWTEQDRKQVSRAAQSLSLALSMDTERSVLKEQTKYFRETLSNSLHQVKNPLQALRTYGKLLQQRIANNGYQGEQTPQLLNLAQQLSVQSDRVVDLLLPMDTLVDESGPPLHLLAPSKEPERTAALTRWQGSNEAARGRIPWANHTVEYSNEYMHDNNRRSRLHSVTSSSEISSDRDSVAKQEDAPRSPTFSASDEMEMAFIQDVLEPILSGFGAIASEKGVDFHVIQEDDELPGITVSPKSLQEAVSNVIDNAFKYAVLPKPECVFTRNPSPRVSVRLSANQKPLAPGVTILVEDNGPGIANEERNEIFQRGFRSESTSSIGGSGIGLDISRSMITQMGGLIEVAQDDESISLDGAAMKIVLFRNPNVQQSSMLIGNF